MFWRVSGQVSYPRQAQMKQDHMDERCATEHAKLLAGTCPWCGKPVLKGQVVDDPLSEQEQCDFTDTRIEFKELGPSLKQVVERDGALDWQQAVRYVIAAAQQLSEVHKTQQVHRHVTPSNIFIALEGEKSVRLGVAAHQFLYQSIDEESVPSIVDCLAPEQALKPQAVDGRADIYSLGCTFYFLLAGRMPFPSGSISERLLKHQTATPESISSLRADVPIEVVQVCEKMMAKKPTDRYATAGEVVAALTSFEAQR